MYVDKDRCLCCGSRVRPAITDKFPRFGNGYYDSVSPDGSFREVPVWFCSLECYEKLVGKYLDPAYYFNKGMRDDPELYKEYSYWFNKYSKIMGRPILINLFNPNAYKSLDDCMKPHKDKLEQVWYERKRAAIYKAEERLLDEVLAELKEKERIRQEKEAEQLEKEQRRAQREQARQDEYRRREQMRLDEKRKREDEKREKEEAERAAKQAEDEKWEPQEFGNI
jgi:hypothetical protein